MPNQSEFLPPSAYRPARWFPNDVRGANHAFASSINASMYAARCDAVTQTRMSSANLTSTKRPPTSSKSISSGHTPPTKHPFQHGTKTAEGSARILVSLHGPFAFELVTINKTAISKTYELKVGASPRQNIYWRQLRNVAWIKAFRDSLKTSSRIHCL